MIHNYRNPLFCSIVVVAVLVFSTSFAAGGGDEPKMEHAPFDVRDLYLKRLQSSTISTAANGSALVTLSRTVTR